MNNNVVIPENIEKLKTSQYLRFMNITPHTDTKTWKLIGVGITDLETSYNPQVDTEKWIIEDTARNDHTGNQKQSSVTQKCYKNDPIFEFANAGRDKLNYTTEVLEIDTWDGEGGVYSAKLSDALLTVSSYTGAEIGYNLYFNGDPEEGTASIENGVPTFINVSL